MLIRKAFAFFVAASLIAGAATAHSGNEIRPGVYRLAGADPNLPQEDLKPLRRVLEGASVVALGENVHTVGGFYRMKHRVFRFLVEEMNFRAFAFETTWARAEQVETYLDSCRTTPVMTADQARNGLYAVWQSVETRDLLQWMCDWNQAHPGDPVTLFGFDVQQPQVDGPALIAFLERIGVAPGTPLLEDIRVCDGVVEISFPDPVSDEDFQTCLAALDEVERLFDEERRNIIRQTSKEDFEWAKIRLVGVRGWEEAVYDLEGDPIRRFEARDKAMAYVFEHIRKLKVGNARTAVWGHNAHIVHHETEVNGYTGMGTWLKERFGHKYAVVALTALETFLNWNFVHCGSGALPVNPGSVEDVLSGLGEDYLLVDLDFKGPDPLFEKNGRYELGANPWIPRRQFEAVIYLRSAPAMTPLRWTTCTPPE